MSEKQIVQASLTTLMNTLLCFNEATPSYLYSRTVEPMNKFARTRAADGSKIDNPCIDCERKDEKGKPLCKLVKFSKQMIRVNDNYESAVIRRQVTEAKMRGEELKPEDMFIADKAAWGAKVDKNTPSLFEWWIPEYTNQIQFYMAYRPVQCMEVWFEAAEACTIDGVVYSKGDKIPKDVEKKLRQEYMALDDDMEAVRQDVDKAVGWRKVRFDNILEMSIGGTRYAITDHTMPPVPPKQQEKLMAMVKERDERKELEARAKKDKARKVVGQPDVVKPETVQ